MSAGSKKNAVSESPTASIQPGLESTQTNSSGKVEDDWESGEYFDQNCQAQALLQSSISQVLFFMAILVVS